MFGMEDASFSQQNEGRTRSAPAVRNAVRALDAVAASSGIGVSELARRTGLSKSTVHGIVTALADEGVLVVGPDRTYALGPRLLEIAASGYEGHLLATARGALARVAESSGTTTLFGRKSGEHVSILALEHGPASLNLSAQVGTRVPILAGALGKAYLATLNLDAARRFLEQRALPRSTNRSVTDIERYLEQVEAAREAGYATDVGEYLDGVSAAASAFARMGMTYVLWMIGIEAGSDVESMGRHVRDALAEIRTEISAESNGGGER